MADQPEARDVHVTFWDEPVKRTEAEIEELRAAGLLREQQAVVREQQQDRGGVTATAPAASGAAGTPAGATPPGNGKEK